MIAPSIQSVRESAGATQPAASKQGRGRYLLFAAPDWRLYELTDPPRTIALQNPETSSPQEIADQIAAALAPNRTASTLLIAPSSHHCLAAHLEHAPAPNTGSPRPGIRSRLDVAARTQLLYRFEELLPLDAEELAADFLTVPGGRLAVGIQVAEWIELIQALADRQIQAPWIVPASILAWQQVAHANPDPLLDCDLLLLCESDHIEFFELQDRRPSNWRIHPNHPEPILRELTLLSSNRPAPLRLAVVNPAPPILAALQTTDCRMRVIQNLDLEASTLAAGRRIALGYVHPPVNLRQGELAQPGVPALLRRPLMQATTSLALLMIILAAGMFLHGHRHHRLALDREAKLMEIHARLLPGEARPTDALPRLRNHWRSQAALHSPPNLSGATQPGASRISGTSGVSGVSGVGVSGAGVDLAQLSAGDLLERILASLPGDDELRYRLIDLRIDSDRVLIEGQARSHTAADRIASGLRSIAQLTFDPPKTEQASFSTSTHPVVSFSLSGTLMDSTAKTKRTGGAP